MLVCVASGVCPRVNCKVQQGWTGIRGSQPLSRGLDNISKCDYTLSRLSPRVGQ